MDVEKIQPFPQQRCQWCGYKLTHLVNGSVFLANIHKGRRWQKLSDNDRERKTNKKSEKQKEIYWGKVREKITERERVFKDFRLIYSHIQLSYNEYADRTMSVER